MLNQFNPSAPQRRKSLARGCVALFGLPFFIPGMLLALWIAWMNWQTLQQAGWLATEVIVLQVPDNEDDLRDPIKGMHYLYDAGGESFTIRDTTPHLAMMTGDDEKRALIERAKAALRGSEPLLCWVNPVRPEEHTLDPARPSFIQYFLGIFTFSHGLLGLLLLTGQWGMRRENPSENHLARPGQTTSSRKDRRWIAALAVILLLNAFTIPSALRLWFDISAPPGGNVMTSGIPFWVAVGVLVFSLLPMRLAWRHFKSVRLNRSLLLSHPMGASAYAQSFRMSLGHMEPGQELPQEVLSATEWKAKCKLQEDGVDSEGDRTTRYKLVRGVDLQPMAQGGGSLRLAGEKVLPGNAGRSDLFLEITGRTQSGVPLGPFQISLPREAGADSGNGNFGDSKHEPDEPHLLLEAEQVQHRKNSDGSQTWEFPGSRFATAGRILFITGVLVAGIDALMIAFLLVGGFQPAFIICAAFTFASVLLFALHHYLSADRSVQITPQSLILRTRSRLLKKEREFALSSIVSFEPITKVNINGRPFYHVELTSINQVGKAVRTMISGLMADRRAAVEVADQMKGALGRRT